MGERDALDDLLGGGIPSVKFPHINSGVEGTVIAVDHVQETDFESQAPLTWDDGSPRMQVVLTLQTDERDPSIEQDDGQRKLYCKFKIKQALAAALRAAGHPRNGSMIGGRLRMTWSSEEPSTRRGFSAKKLYTGVWTAPAQVALLDDTPPAAAPQTAAQPAAAAPAAQPASPPAASYDDDLPF